MYRSDGHLCKQSPLQVALFYMESSHVTTIDLFRGILKISVQVVKQVAAGSRQSTVNLPPVIQHVRVDIKDHNPLFADNLDVANASKSMKVSFIVVERLVFPIYLAVHYYIIATISQFCA